MCAEFWGDRIVQMEDPAVVCKFTGLFVKLYILFLRDACAFVLPFGSSGVIIGLYSKEKCTCNQLANGCVQIIVILLVDVNH